jgi:hypothetical protein
MERRRIAYVAAAAAIAAGAGLTSTAPATAHHSYTMFDLAREATVSGVVADFQWTAPHAWIELTVPTKRTPSGVEVWSIEGMSPSYLARRGWTRKTLRPGDKVSIVIHPLKDGSHGGTVVRVTLQDGRVLDPHGA